MNKETIGIIHQELEAVQQGRIAPGRTWKLEKNAAGNYVRTDLDPEKIRRERARAWEARNAVAHTRQTINLSQKAFAEMLGVSINTLRNWEQRKSEPSGAARTLLILAEKYPELVMEAASDACLGRDPG